MLDYGLNTFTDGGLYATNDWLSGISTYIDRTQRL
jgi:hypothetical protein